MTKQAETVLQVGLAAAVADGHPDERELGKLRELARFTGVDARILEGEMGLPPDLASRLPTEEARRAAYELAVAVCNADGLAEEAEQRFLAGLRGMLGISAEATALIEHDAEAIASATIATPVPAPAARQDPAGLDELILRQAKLTGALELLPQSLATMAIIPLQMRMVYSIGQAYGQSLDASQVKDLLGTLGIGVAAQVVDGVARKLVGGVLGGVLGDLIGGLAGGVAKVATGAATTFAATYALGHAAKQYYAQGRRLSTGDLRALFDRLRGDATNLYPQVRGEIETQARGLDVQQVLRSVGKS